MENSVLISFLVDRLDQQVEEGYWGRAAHTCGMLALVLEGSGDPGTDQIVGEYLRAKMLFQQLSPCLQHEDFGRFKKIVRKLEALQLVSMTTPYW